MDSPPDYDSEPFSLHLQALRQLLIQTLATLALTSVLTFSFRGNLSLLLYKSLSLTDSQHLVQIAALHPLEGVLTDLRLSFYAAILISLPSIAFFLARFLFPALLKKERLFLIFFFIAFFFALCLALYSSFKGLFPLANAFLLKYNAQNGLMNLWSAHSIVSFFVQITFLTTLLLFAFLQTLMLVILGVVPKNFFKTHRPTFILGALVFAAFVTPPDVFTQVALAIPMIFLYELLALISKLK